MAIGDELYVYLVDDGDGPGIAYFETAGGQRIPLVAENSRQATQLLPIARRLGELLERPVTLARFSGRQMVELPAEVTP